MVNVPNFSVDPNATVAQANASVTAAAEAASRELNRTVARQVVRPSQTAVPAPIRNQTNDQYLAGMLQKTQATPKAQGQFASKFPELRSDFRRTKKMQQPMLNATNPGGMAAWLANGTGAPAAAAKGQPTGPNAANVQVAHTDEVNGQSLADWANVPVTNSPASAAVADAIANTETSSVEPVVPEQYRNMKIPGLPDDARIMSVEDRVVSPAVIPGSNATAGTAGTSLAAPTTTSGVPVEIQNMVPPIIDNRVPQPTMSAVTSQTGTNMLPPQSTVLGPPSAAIGHPTTSLPPTTMTMQAPQFPAPSQSVFPQSMPAVSMPAHAQVAPMMATPQPPVTMSQNMAVMAPQMQPNPPAPQQTGLPTGVPVQLTMEQIKNLPPGTKLIPANNAAVAALRGQLPPTVPPTVPQAALTTTAPLSQPAQQPVSRPATQSVPQQVAIQRANTPKPKMRTTIIKPGKILRTPAASSVTTSTVEIPATVAAATASNDPVTVAASAADSAPVVATTVTPQTIAVPSGPTQSMMVKDRLNRAFEICRTDPITAESEFLEILRYIATAHDDAEGLDSYAPAFERGLLTMREAEQMQETLMSKGEEAALQLAHSFRSDVSQSFSEGKISTAEVVDAYYLYARHSMMIAIGEQPLGSQALYGWGQLCSTRSQRQGYHNGIEQGKASLILAAALDADETNWRAHNEMGIIFARQGEYAESEKSFRRSLALNPTDETYNNVAKVVDRQSKPNTATQGMPTLTREPADTSTYVQTKDVQPKKPASTSAQVGAQQPLGEESSRRSKVKAFVDRLMGNDEPAKSYQDDDGIPITAN